jgi:hypothetical protein
MNIRQTAINAIVVEAEPLVVEAQQMHRGGVQIVTAGGVHCSLIAEFIGLTVGGPAADAASRDPDRERARLVVATFSLGSGLTDKHRSTHHKGIVELANKLTCKFQAAERTAPVKSSQGPRQFAITIIMWCFWAING